MSGIATVVAFDPGGTTGWAAMSVPAHVLNSEQMVKGISPLHEAITKYDTGQIDCGTGGEGWQCGVGRGHGQMNIDGEITGIDAMVRRVDEYDKPAIVLEEFTLEQNNKHSDLLLPVRIMAGFWNALGWYQSEMGGMGTHDGKVAEQLFINRRVDAMTVVTDARLRTWGFHKHCVGPHSRDATRHAYHFLRRARGGSLDAQELRWRAWPHLFDDPGRLARKSKPKAAKKQGEIVTFG